jgi:hypothetical protein
MSKRYLLGLIGILACVFLIGACGGGGGGGGDDTDSHWNSGSEHNPTGSMVDSAGETVTSAAPNQPMIGKATGLLHNGVYKVAILDPNGDALYDEDLLLVSDGEGTLNDTMLAYLGNDTNAQGMVLGTKDFKAVVGGEYKVYFCKETETHCNASTASTSTTLTVDTTEKYVYSANADGDGVNSFLNETGKVYAVVQNGPPSVNVALRIVANNFQILADGDPLPDDVSTTVEVCTTDADGNCDPTLIWDNATAEITNNQAAMFDIIVDVANDGIWDADVDFMDSPGYVAGFAIQEETPSNNFGAIVIGSSDIVTDVACTEAGSGYCTHTDIFSALDVYGYVNPSVQSQNPHQLAYKFIILHDDHLADGDDLTPIQSFGYDHTVDPLQWGCTNEGRILLWPKATQVPGCYDVVLDVNKNLKYDAGTDIIDGYRGTCGFIVPGAEGGPELEFGTFTDGDNEEVGDGGETSSTVANVTFTPTFEGDLKQCEIRWAAGQSSSVAALDISTMTSDHAFTTQNISLFNGNNTVMITCVDEDNLAGSLTATIKSTAEATGDIHFQSTLVWQLGSTAAFDMDLHTIMPGATIGSAGDCYYSNCKEASGGNATVGAFLNVDCTYQCMGPENIWLPDTTALTAGNYAVCVVPYAGEGTSLNVSLFNSSGSLIETVSKASLSNSASEVWYVGNFTCTAGTSGTCTWSTVNSTNVAPCSYAMP